MRNQIFKFKTFNSSNEFEDWQKENGVNIYQFSPIMLETDNTLVKGSMTIKTKIGCFIVYA